MEYKNKKADLIEASMQVVAENGLSAFSMKKVTQRVGVSEALIYRHFETKENLLYVCHETVHRQIAALFAGMTVQEMQTKEEAYEIVRHLWMTYFSFLVQNDYRTIFYFEYRDSPYIRKIKEGEQETKNTYFKSFTDIYYAFDRQFHVSQKTSSEHLWTYILDTAGIFAKRIIRGELPNTQESYECVWKLIFGGFFGLFQE